jgi:hypothetical protein
MAALRKVQTLHLRAAQQSLLQRGAILIEDGLRTASFPGADGSRLLIVRRLSLGTIGSAWSPMSVSLLIENRFRQLSASAVHAEDSQAEHASVVFFRDEVEPYLALALRIALGKDTSAWFWRQAVKDWHPGMSRKQALRTVLYSILCTTPGSLSILHLVQTLLRAYALEVLLSSLEPEDGTMLLQAFGWSASDFSSRGLHAEGHSLFVRSTPEMQILAIACDAWGETDGRSLWLASILLVMRTPALQHSPALPQHTRSLIRIARKRATVTLASESEKVRSSSDQSAESASRTTEQELRGRLPENADTAAPQSSTPSTEKSELQRSTYSAELKQLAERRDPLELIQSNEPEQLAKSAATEDISAVSKSAHNISYRAGLFFLLPVMERTGLPIWLEENPETHGPSLAAWILHHFAQRLKTPSSDAVWLALEEIENPVPDKLIQFWVSRVRSYCRRAARIGLQSLTCRTGRLSVTPTHIDVQFPASEADIRIRRIGLDIDPGWLPWFGRVVHFQYLFRGDFDA